MSITLTDKGAPLDSGDLEHLESRLGHSLPEAYRAFVLQHNVAVPESNQLKQGDFTTAVSVFFGVSGNPDEDLKSQVDMYSGRLPPGLLPIASTAGGSLICLHLSTAEIFLWDHEGEAGDSDEVTYENTRRLSSSLDDFLRELQPFDAATVPLEPGTVILKMKPGFYEKFKKA